MRATRFFLRSFGPATMYVVSGEAGIAQARGHRFSGGGDVADRVRRIDLDELLENLMRERIHGGGLARNRRPSEKTRTNAKR